MKNIRFYPYRDGYKIKSYVRDYANNLRGYIVIKPNGYPHDPSSVASNIKTAKKWVDCIIFDQANNI